MFFHRRVSVHLDVTRPRLGRCENTSRGSILPSSCSGMSKNLLVVQLHHQHKYEMVVMVLTLSARHIRKILDVFSIGEIQQTSTYYLVYYYRVESWSLR